MLTAGREYVVNALMVIGHGSQVVLEVPKEDMTKPPLAKKALVLNEALSVLGWI